jgi:hypothetical protein
MNLVYINKIGQNWKGNYVYEFLFSDVLEDIDGDGWDSYPSLGNPEPPEDSIIKKSGSWFSFEETKLGQGRDSVKNILTENPDLAEILEKRITEALKTGGTVAAEK